MRSSCWGPAAGGTSASSGARQSGGGSAAGAGRLHSRTCGWPCGSLSGRAPFERVSRLLEGPGRSPVPGEYDRSAGPRDGDVRPRHCPAAAVSVATRQGPPGLPSSLPRLSWISVAAPAQPAYLLCAAGPALSSTRFTYPFARWPSSSSGPNPASAAGDTQRYFVQNRNLFTSPVIARAPLKASLITPVESVPFCF